MKITNEFEYTEEVPDGYKPLTWAYDLISTEDFGRMIEECRRQESHGESVLIYWFDTRKLPRKVRIMEHDTTNQKRWTNKESAYGEIWVRSHDAPNQSAR